MRAVGRGFVVAALAAALALVGAVGYFIDSALAAPAASVPTPSITSSPANPTTSSSAAFKYSDTKSGVTFDCSLDSSKFASCPTTGVSYTNLAVGSHTFSVEALSGNQTSSATSYSWTITPAAPKITSSPANPTATNTAAFKYSDTSAGVAFVCSLDGSSYSPCPSSGVSYTKLGDGSHTFSVEATLAHATSSPAAYTWRVDTTAPTVSVTFPSGGGSYNTAGWTGGCSPVGVCGTAADPSGVAAVKVGVQQSSTGKYWNGTSFSSNSLVLNAATGTTTWHYSLARPADGGYKLFVSAADTLGNSTASSALTTVSFTIDTVAPPAPQIVIEPSNPTSSTTAVFDAIDSAWPNVTFSCRLDNGAVTACTTFLEGAAVYNNLAPGQHCFYVYATDPAGNQSPTTSYCWTVNGTTKAAAIAVSSGSPQYTTVSTAYGQPLVAKVTDSSNNPVSGVTVTFTAPASGASGTFASCPGTGSNATTCVETTNSSGLATAATFTANATPGPYTVTAATSGVTTPASFSLTNVANFTISGNIPPPFYPGASQPVNLSITNPNPTQITVPAGSITVTVTTSNEAACPGAANFTMAQSLTQQVVIAGNSTQTLQQLSVPASAWPVVTMLNTNTNQDGCKNVSLTLHYSGSANG